jgi:hypothetical protein
MSEATHLTKQYALLIHKQQFIFNIVGCVMNAYNNITWESDRLEYEEGHSPYGNTLLAILGIPSEPSKGMSLLHKAHHASHANTT